MRTPGQTSTDPTPVDCASASAELLSLYSAAWPGVRINRLFLTYDPRPVDSIGGDIFADSLSIDVSLSGTPEAMVSTGLLTIDEIPAQGQRTLGYFFHVIKGKSTVRLVASHNESWERNGITCSPITQRLLTQMAQALWRRVSKTNPGWD